MLRFSNRDESVSAWKSSSLYVGDLSEGVVETDLLKIFSIYGPLESVKVCRNWDTGQPLGYGFLNFEREQDAEMALRQHNFKHIKGRQCRLMWSTKRSASSLKEDHAANVFIKGLAKTVENQLLHEMFSQCGTVLSSRVARNEKGGSLGYGYVSFTSYPAADAAIKLLNGKDLHGQRISVEPFIDKTQREEKPWSNIHVMGVPPHWTKDTLIERFQVYGEIRSAVIMKSEFGVSRGFGFVDFVDHHGAALAVEENQGLDIDSGNVDAQGNFIFEEKEHSGFGDAIFQVKLRVTPALKRGDRLMQKIPRAAQGLPMGMQETPGFVGASSMSVMSQLSPSYMPHQQIYPRSVSAIPNNPFMMQGLEHLSHGDRYSNYVNPMSTSRSADVGNVYRQGEEMYFDYNQLERPKTVTTAGSRSTWDFQDNTDVDNDEFFAQLSRKPLNGHQGNPANDNILASLTDDLNNLRFGNDFQENISTFRSF